jgi:cellulose biosynthesis operon protein BcsF/YhjT
MDIIDIIEIFIVAALVFIPLGYALHNRLPGWRIHLAARFLTPRYLTPMTVSMINKSRKHAKTLADAPELTGKPKTPL